MTIRRRLTRVVPGRAVAVRAEPRRLLLEQPEAPGDGRGTAARELAPAADLVDPGRPERRAEAGQPAEPGLPEAGTRGRRRPTGAVQRPPRSRSAATSRTLRRPLGARGRSGASPTLGQRISASSQRRVAGRLPEPRRRASRRPSPCWSRGPSRSAGAVMQELLPALQREERRLVEAASEQLLQRRARSRRRSPSSSSSCRRSSAWPSRTSCRATWSAACASSRTRPPLIGSGQFGQRIAIGSEDELGDLARAFNEMSDQLSSAHRS